MYTAIYFESDVLVESVGGTAQDALDDLQNKVDTNTKKWCLEKGIQYEKDPRLEIAGDNIWRSSFLVGSIYNDRESDQ